MKISTKGRYAVRVMLDLAVHNTGEYIKVKKIAERQEISEKYLEQIISVLNKAGYVKSTRGPRGLSYCRRSRRLYGRHDTAPDGRESLSGGVPGG